jgi:hypothetical protein
VLSSCRLFGFTNPTKSHQVRFFARAPSGAAHAARVTRRIVDMPTVAALGEFVKRSALRAASGGFLLLRRSEVPGVGPFAALSRRSL